MIQSFADADTEELFHEEKNRRFSAVARVALRKLMQMNRAARLSDLAVLPGTPWKRSKETASASTRSGSMSSGASSSAGRTPARPMSPSWTIIDVPL